MSPTSYRAAPPRKYSLSTANIGVKSLTGKLLIGQGMLPIR
jgi:hypothetical protein